MIARENHTEEEDHGANCRQADDYNTFLIKPPPHLRITLPQQPHMFLHLKRQSAVYFVYTLKNCTKL